VGALRKEESEMRSMMDREKERIIARLITLRVEKDGKAKEIVEQQGRPGGDEGEEKVSLVPLEALREISTADRGGGAEESKG